MAVRRKHIRTLVEQLLGKHRIREAPVPVERIAEALGAEVRREEADNELCGFLLRDLKRRQAVIGVNSTHHENRQRFTIAHEIAHFLLHEGGRIHVDGVDCGYRLNFRDPESSTGNNEAEKEANYFAAELLMPKQFLEEDIKQVKDGIVDLLDEESLQRALKPLADRYEVSTQALTFRLANLGYIDISIS